MTITMQEVPDLEIIDGRPTITFSKCYVKERFADVFDILTDLIITRRIHDLCVQIED